MEDGRDQLNALLIAVGEILKLCVATVGKTDVTVTEFARQYEARAARTDDGFFLVFSRRDVLRPSLSASPASE